MMKSKYRILIFSIALLLFLFTIICSSIEGKTEDTGIDYKTSFKTASDWAFPDGTPVNFPYSEKGVPGEPVIISGTIPDYGDSDLSICFQSVYCSVRVFIDDEQFASYATDSHYKNSRLSGNIRILKRLPDENASGRKITIEFVPAYTQAVEIYAPDFGSYGDLRADIFLKNLFRIVVDTILFVIGISAIYIAFGKATRKDSVDKWAFNYFGLFCICVGVWIICSSDLPQFITNRNDTVSFISYVALSTMAVPFAGFCEKLFTAGNRHMEILHHIGLALPIVNTVCYLFNICDPPALLTCSHIHIAITMFSALVFSIIGARKDEMMRRMLLGLVILAISVGLGLGGFFLAPSRGYDALFFGTGVVAMVIALCSILIRRQLEFAEESRNATLYKELAYKDMMTGFGNRTSFDRYFKDLEYKPMGTIITLVMFDANFLKETNDNWGHQEGDRLIKRITGYIQTTFKGVGECYRLGGDEFAVIMEDRPKQAKEYLERLEESIYKGNYKCEVPVSVSCGYAEMEWDKTDVFMRKIYKEADKNLYLSKNHLHEVVSGPVATLRGHLMTDLLE